MSGLIILETPKDNDYINKTIIGISGSVIAEDVSIKASVNNGAFENVFIEADNTFAHKLIGSQGKNEIIIHAVDLHGNENVIKRIVSIDLDYPILSSVLITPNPVEPSQKIKIYLVATDDEKQTLYRKIGFELGRYKALRV